MKLQYFFGCILATGLMGVFPDISLAHGGEVEEAAVTELGVAYLVAAMALAREVGGTPL